MELVVNGEKKIFRSGITIKDILKELKIENKVMAVAVNLQVIKKDNWGVFKPKNGDKLEFLQFVGGG